MTFAAATYIFIGFSYSVNPQESAFILNAKYVKNMFKSLNL